MMNRTHSMDTRKTSTERGKKSLTKRIATAGLVTACLTGTMNVQSATLGDLSAAWNAWLDTRISVMEGLLDSDAYGIDEHHEYGLYDLLIGMANNQQKQHMSPSGSGLGGYPRFVAFDDPDTRIGWDNPDTRYLGSAVDNTDGLGIYRMWGNRSNTADMLITTFSTASGSGAGGNLAFGDMFNTVGGPLQLNEEWEVYFSTQAIRNANPQWDNWVELPAAANVSMQNRYTACDWATEVPGDVFIEKVGNYGTAAAPRTNEQAVQGMLNAATVYQAQVPFIPAIALSWKATLNANEAIPWQPTGSIGIQDQWSLQTWFDLEDTEALILTFKEPIANYYGFEITNFFASSREWAHRQSSLNWGHSGGCQAEQTNDGLYHIVLSKQDPGVKNWVDTTGLTEGNLIGRLQGTDPSELAALQADWDNHLNPQPGYVYQWAPTSQVVNIADVQSTLTSMGATDYSVYNATDRSDQLKIRQDYARKKYAPW